jgi:hypothetical protein
VIPIWLIQADVFGRSFEPVKTAIRQQGFVWEVVHPGPFLKGLVPVVGGHRLTDEDCVIFSGTVPLMRHIQLHYPWIPGGWCSAGQFDCTSYYPSFSRYLLNTAHAVLTVEEGLARVGEVFAQYGRGGKVFVRPCGVQKTFTGRCADRAGFVLALESARYAKEPVLVASPREIRQEWRVVVARGRFVAASRYRSEERLSVAPGCPQEVRAYVDALLAEVPYRPDPIFMLDVCLSDNELFLLELNSFSCSGLYQCDPTAVVKVVKDLALEEWQRARATPDGPRPTVRGDGVLEPIREGG